MHFDINLESHLHASQANLSLTREPAPPRMFVGHEVMTMQECLADALSIAQVFGGSTVPVCQSLSGKTSPPVSLPNAMSAEPSATAACTTAEALLGMAFVTILDPEMVYFSVKSPRSSPCSLAANNVMQVISRIQPCTGKLAI